MKSICFALAFVILVPPLCGCGPAEEPRYALHGTVKFKGQPIREGRIAFSNAAKGVHLNAEVGQDGSYEVTSYRGKGVPTGEYTVSILPSVLPSPPPRDLWPFIPMKYRNPATSGLTFTVAEGDNLFDVDMKP
ncbi:MAG: hypothetical protein U9N87_09205 [Planctomycetota bacterium]|nr:hypothetical protein [Planctomycetota bacterium]